MHKELQIWNNTHYTIVDKRSWIFMILLGRWGGKIQPKKIFLEKKYVLDLFLRLAWYGAELWLHQWGLVASCYQIGKDLDNLGRYQQLVEKFELFNVTIPDIVFAGVVSQFLLAQKTTLTSNWNTALQYLGTWKGSRQRNVILRLWAYSNIRFFWCILGRFTYSYAVNHRILCTCLGESCVLNE